MAESELYRKGAAMRRQLMGEAEVERLGRTTYGDPVMKKFLDVATETVFGALWTRPGLDRRSRSLVTLGALIALRAGEELKFHFPIALRNGLTAEELEEVVYHLTGYVGFPAATLASNVGREVLPQPDRQSGG